jgi:hypothetical protein
MLSPKMQRSVRVNENQLIMLSDKAQNDKSVVSAFLLSPPVKEKIEKLKINRNCFPY